MARLDPIPALRSRRVLLTGDVFYGVLGALRALRRAGWEPWVTVSAAGTYAGRSRAAAGTVAAPDAEREPEAFLAAVADAAARLGAAAVLPGDEAALVALAGREDAFPAGVALGAPARAIVERATDRLAVATLARDVGFHVPPTAVVRRTQCGWNGSGIVYPVVVKPIRSKSRTARGPLAHVATRRVESEAELREVLAAFPAIDWVAQPYLHGTLHAVAGVAWRGEMICAVHQVAHRIGPPVCGVSAYAETVAPDDDVDDRCRRLLRDLEWSGIYQAQFIRNQSGAYLIDLNPRIYGSVALAVAAGLNLPALWLELLLGGRPEAGAYRVGVRYRSEEKDVLAVADALVRRRWQAVLEACVPHRDTVHAVFSIRDPLPVVTTLAKLGRARELWAVLGRHAGSSGSR